MMAQKHSFLVVGSGGGGGTIAWVLAKAGYDVLLLEQGRDFAAKYREDKEDFNPALHDESYFRLRKPDPKRRLRGDYNTFMERDKESAATPFSGGWTGSIVGGGSVLWGTWAFRALPIDYKLKSHFQRTRELTGLEKEGYAIADWPIAYSEMLPFYGVAEALMGVSGDREAVNDSIKESDWYKAFNAEDYWGREAEWFPDPKQQPFPMPAYPTTPIGHLVAEGFKHAGMHPFPLPVAIVKPGSDGLKTRTALQDVLAAQQGAIPGDIWKKKADDLWSAQIRQACNMCGFCGEYLCWGRTGPKWGTQDTTLKELAGTRELTVRPNAKAIEVLYDGVNRRATGVAYLDLSDPDHPRRLEASADHVIVSCGAVQTPRLLFLSGSDNGLGNSSDQLGRNATFHMFGLGTKVTLDPRFQGLLHGEFGSTGNISTFAQYFMKHPATGAWVKGGHLTSSAKKNPLEDAVTAVVRDGKLGKGLLDGITEHNRKLELRLTADDLPMPENRVTLDPTYVDEYGIPVARIARRLGANEKRVFEAAKPLMESVFRRYQDGKNIVSSLATDDAILKLIGDHQMGTCRMGDDPKNSVVNRFCRLHDAENVFVVDSSFMPTGLGLNPMVTVVANALRVGTHIVDRLKRGETPGRA